MKKRVIFCALIVVFLLIITGCNIKEKDVQLDFYTTEQECFDIKTEYATLKYPEKWKNEIKTEIIEGDPYTILFSRITNDIDMPLFELSFGISNGDEVGKITIEGSDIGVYIDEFDINKNEMSEEEYLECCAMLEDVNVIISKMIENEGLVLTNKEPITDYLENDGSIYGIETKYGVISYPKKWKNIVITKDTNGEPYAVKFYCQGFYDIPLFDLVFNGDDGYLLGYIKEKEVSIRIIEYEIDRGSMTDDDYFNCCAMQEDVNVILQYLVEDYGFEYAME